MLTARLASFVADTKSRDIPREFLESARDAVIDTLGVGLAGVSEPVSELVAKWTAETGGPASATVWGRRTKAAPSEAAFANAISAHALDFDDTLPSMRGHPSVVIVPAALAVAEAIGSSGKDVLAAYVIGLEVAGKLGQAANEALFRQGWHTTPTIGVFAATAVAARLWGLDANALQHAWGLAASQVSGIIRNFGTMTKPFHAGHATRCGMFSAWMAREGFTADPNVLDGPDGIFATYGKVDGPTLERSLERLGSPWEMQDPGIYAKQWPCCYCNHRPVGGLLQLIEEHGIGIEEVTAISVGFLPGSDSSLVSENPRTGLEGKFSIEYAAAATLLDRKLTLDTFTDHMVQRPRIRELMKKVRRYRIEDSRIYSGVVGFTDVAVDTPRGTFKVRVDKTPGSPAWPLSSEARVRKFLDCSGRALGDEGAKRLLAIAHDLAALPDVGELLSATVPSGASASHTQGSASSSIA